MKTWWSLFIIIVIGAGCAAKFRAQRQLQVQEQLKSMVEVDQVAAYIPQGKYKEYTKEQWQQFQDSVFTAHKTITERLLDTYGFLGFDKVGREASNHFWLIVQHCDQYPAFQSRVLTAMDKEVKKGNANPNNYAYLYDRVKVNAGDKQLFGTQVTYETETTGRAVPKIGVADSNNIDRRRKEYSLEPLKDYLNMMTTMHYEMNKEQYQAKGIKAPDLYP